MHLRVTVWQLIVMKRSFINKTIFATLVGTSPTVSVEKTDSMEQLYLMQTSKDAGSLASVQDIHLTCQRIAVPENEYVYERAGTPHAFLSSLPLKQQTDRCEDQCTIPPSGISATCHTSDFYTLLSTVAHFYLLSGLD